ncbi:MAG: hypothetical protein E7480_05740 [Ruminococcaceae bacterium]|nr:hypothetical protein [Oscillospiraceae bacterium]
MENKKYYNREKRMKLISDSHFDIREYYGDLIILYPEGYPELVAPLRERLDISGHVYHCRAVGESLLVKGNAFDEIVTLLNHCACLIPVLNKQLFEEENLVSCSMFWYFIGYIRSKLQESIVPYIPKNQDDGVPDLKGTPLQGIDIIFDADTFMSKIPEKFASKLLRYNYYENRTTNFYAARRINFQCLRISFNIYEEAFQNAKLYYNDITGYNRSDSEFDNFLEEHLICGCRVVSFGAEERLEPQMMVYKEEVHPYIADYPKSFVGKKSYRRFTANEREESGIRAEFVFDVLIPVHKILGAYIKCYLTCRDTDCPVFMLLALMEPDFAEGSISELDFDRYEDASYWKGIYPEQSHVDTRFNRLYFSLNFELLRPLLKADPALNVGETVDFIFPQ